MDTRPWPVGLVAAAVVEAPLAPLQFLRRASHSASQFPPPKRGGSPHQGLLQQHVVGLLPGVPGAVLSTSCLQQPLIGAAPHLLHPTANHAPVEAAVVGPRLSLVAEGGRHHLLWLPERHHPQLQLNLDSSVQSRPIQLAFSSFSSIFRPSPLLMQPMPC